MTKTYEAVPVSEYINGTFKYDPEGQYIWMVNEEDEHQMFAELRGWGAIQNLFPMTEAGQKAAEEFQDQVGEWLASALNEKIKPCTDTETFDPLDFAKWAQRNGWTFSTFNDSWGKYETLYQNGNSGGSEFHPIERAELLSQYKLDKQKTT